MPCCRVVLDTNICLDLFVFQDKRCNRLAEMLQKRLVQAITRNDCRDEWLRVLEYPAISLNDSSRKQCLIEYDQKISCCDFKKKNYCSLPICKDSDDQKFLELAYDAQAKFLITKDKALLKLSAKTKRLELFHIIRPEELHLTSMTRLPVL